MVFLLNHHFPMVFLWFSCGFPMVFLLNHHFPMVFLWFSPFSYGFPMVFLWFSPFSYGFPIKSPFSYHFPMVFLWFSYGFPGCKDQTRAPRLQYQRCDRPATRGSLHLTNGLRGDVVNKSEVFWWIYGSIVDLWSVLTSVYDIYIYIELYRYF